MTIRDGVDYKNGVFVLKAKPKPKLEDFSADELMQGIIDEVDQEFVDKKKAQEQKIKEQKEQEEEYDRLRKQNKEPYFSKNFLSSFFGTLFLIYVVFSDNPGYAFISGMALMTTIVILFAIAYWVFGGSFFKFFYWPKDRD